MKLTLPEDRADKIAEDHRQYLVLKTGRTFKDTAVNEIRAALKELVEMIEKHGKSLYTAHVILMLIKGLVNEVLPEEEQI